MRIEDISIFGEYKQAENRVTAAFLQICKIGGEDLIRFLANNINIQIPSSEIEIHSQVKGKGSVPDGLLESNFSFKLYVESKIQPNAINPVQLKSHHSQLSKPTDFLLYLTPDNIKPVALGSTHWANWKQIITTFNDYLESAQTDNNQLLEFLIKHFNTLLDNLGLLGYTWNLNNDDVIIVAGSWAEGVALNYHYYICQNRRSFKPARYISFYNNNQIRHLFEIIQQPSDEINLLQHPEFQTYIQQADPNYNGDLRKVFKLKFIKNVGPIINDKLDKNNNPCPFTYGQPRYTTLQVLNTSNRTSQL